MQCMRANRICVAVCALSLSVTGCSARLALQTDQKIGFVFIGERDDLGYNQAAWEGSDAVARTFPESPLIRAGSVPETEEAARVMEAQIAAGARLIFATSYGYARYAYDVAKKHPDVIIVHQGGIEPTPRLDNYGTYWGATYEQVYLAGIAAGAATRSGTLGFVGAFPIPSTLNNINAFTLGARRVNPTVKTRIAFTGAWCAPDEQERAARVLLDAGADVLTQHQDCTRTILEASERAGVASVGYHADGSEVAPKGWLVGSVWDWGSMYLAIAQAALGGEFARSRFNGDVVGGLASGDNPFILTEFGSSVDQETQRSIEKEERAISKGASPFTGPLRDREGRVRVKDGLVPSYAEVLRMDYLVDGVIGTLPK